MLTSFIILRFALCGVTVFSLPLFAQGHAASDANTQSGRGAANRSFAIQGIPAEKSNSGILLTPKGDCKTLKVFFPGHAQELGFKGSVPNNREEDWIQYLLGPGNYNLAPKIQESACPVFMLGDSTRFPNSNELKWALKQSGATEVEILSHSGGYDGLDSALSSWDAELLSKISSLALLDNFYRPSLGKKLLGVFGQERLKKICSGFATSHNYSRYDSHFAKLCPGVKKGGSHKSSVRNFF